MRQSLTTQGLLTLFLLLACISVQAQTKKQLKELAEKVETSPVFSKFLTGFVLYEPTSSTFLCEYQADKYFTPASNTKIFTLYTSLIVLKDSIPTFLYQETDTSLVFWGTGHPGFLNPLLPKDSVALQFLKGFKKPLYYSDYNFQEQPLGDGWAWDDFSYTYQLERVPMPMYGQIATFTHKKDALGYEVTPAFMANFVSLNATLPNKTAIFKRSNFHTNAIECNSAALAGSVYQRELPIHYESDLWLRLLSDTLHQPVKLIKNNIPSSDVKAFYSTIPAEAVYQLMMQESDNFIAEQLLLVCSNQLFGIQNTAAAIQYGTDSLLTDLPSKPIWIDGSGLSRYNLFTPRTLVKMLEKINQLLPQEQLFHIFPAGGVSGTIKRWYAPEKGQQPYVYAKTGTLSNQHALSGYLVTKSGKMLIFSFMHNNFTGSINTIRQEMQDIFVFIRDNF